MTKLQERLQYAKDMDHDFIAEKNGNYVSGAWDEVEHAEKCGWNILGSVAELYVKNF